MVWVCVEKKNNRSFHCKKVKNDRPNLPGPATLFCSFQWLPKHGCPVYICFGGTRPHRWVKNTTTRKKMNPFKYFILHPHKGKEQRTLLHHYLLSLLPWKKTFIAFQLNWFIYIKPECEFVRMILRNAPNFRLTKTYKEKAYVSLNINDEFERRSKKMRVRLRLQFIYLISSLFFFF